MWCVVAQCGQSACTCWWITSVGWKKMKNLYDYERILFKYMHVHVVKSLQNFPRLSNIILSISHQLSICIPEYYSSFILKPKFPSVKSCTWQCILSQMVMFFNHAMTNTFVHTFQWQVMLHTCTILKQENLC